ncbi:MAG: AraC family transcriptional regulator [Gemmatirosa sp.]|nr:AraC family transcriptional regulator [Gemmatirosa sp.]
MPDRHAYAARINRVVDHIDAHLGDALDLGALAAVAHCSPWHFHRVFQALTGETVAARVRRRRLEVAALRLLASPPEPALRIALDVGFGSAEVFTRAFRAHFGVTPSAWRRGAHRAHAERRRGEMRKIRQDDRTAHQAVAAGFLQDADVWPLGRHPRTREHRMEVEIRTLLETRVAYMRYVGPYGASGIPQTWQRFGAWCEAHGLMQPRRRMYGISHDNPEVTAPERCRYDACVEVDDAFVPQGEIGVQTIAGGRYACARFLGGADEIHDAWMRFLAEWLPDSHYQPDDRPAFELYERDFFVDAETGAFPCVLCLPVRPL